MIEISVVIITYGHEKFIKQTLDGVFMQSFGLPIEVIISNDHSPDNTDAIVCGYIENHPKKSIIRYFNHKENLGMTPNFLFALQQAKGKYIALCEGDDFWTDRDKLQKQYEFLEANMSFVACIHDSLIFSEIKQETVNTYSNLASYKELWRKDILNRDDLIKKWFCGPTASFFFRNVIDYSKPPEWFYNVYGSDTPLMILLSSNGSIKLLRQSMSVYRIDNVQSKEGIRRLYLYEMYRKTIKQNFYLMNKFEKKYAIYFLGRAATAAKIMGKLFIKSALKR